MSVKKNRRHCFSVKNNKHLKTLHKEFDNLTKQNKKLPQNHIRPHYQPHKTLNHCTITQHQERLK